MFASLLTAWLLVVGASLAWSVRAVERAALDHARSAASATLDKDLAYRLWATRRGGVDVEVDPATPSNPDLADVPERDLTTPSGRHLTLPNPAYMTRQVHELAAERYGLRGHLTSLRPIRPGNGPDAWEEAALRRIAAGAEVVAESALLDGAPHLRLMRRLVTEQPCLRCHAAQGYREGEVRGGLSVAVPLAGDLAAARRQEKAIAVAHAGVRSSTPASSWRSSGRSSRGSSARRRARPREALHLRRAVARAARHARRAARLAADVTRNANMPEDEAPGRTITRHDVGSPRWWLASTASVV